MKRKNEMTKKTVAPTTGMARRMVKLSVAALFAATAMVMTTPNGADAA